MNDDGPSAMKAVIAAAGAGGGRGVARVGRGGGGEGKKGREERRVQVGQAQLFVGRSGSVFWCMVVGVCVCERASV